MTTEPEPPDQDEKRELQEAHGGSMAPGLVDDTGRQITEVPDQSDTSEDR